MKKRFDAVKMVREIRNNLYEKTKRMTSKERIDFYRQEAKEFYAELEKKKPLVTVFN